MKKLAALALIAFAASFAHAADDSACMAAAKEKKLAGAAKNSNVKKCMHDTGPAAS